MAFEAPSAILALQSGGFFAQDDRGEREADQALQGGDQHREDRHGSEANSQGRFLHDDHGDGAAGERSGSSDHKVAGRGDEFAVIVHALGSAEDEGGEQEQHADAQHGRDSDQ